MRTISMAAAMLLVVIGCGKPKSEPGTMDSTARSTDMNMHGDSSHMGGMNGDHHMGMSDSGMTMSGDMEHDMPMMNEMMVRNLGAGDSSYEYRFIDEMIPHHEGAVMMAKDALAKANRPELKKLAESIIASQQKEIDQMKQWKKSWYGDKVPAGTGAASGMMGKMSSMNEMMVKHLGQKDSNYEDRFIDEMIPHHEGGVAMAKDALVKAHRPELKKLAQDIITGQEKEIAQMKEWRRQWYGH
ncbi:MAG: DUF305 domain-containing protein [Candidatus Kapaibacterium sp.]